MELIFNWLESLIIGLSELGQWLITPIATINGIEFSPLGICGVGGLIVVLVVAIVLWVLPT